MNGPEQSRTHRCLVIAVIAPYSGSNLGHFKLDSFLINFKVADEGLLLRAVNVVVTWLTTRALVYTMHRDV